MEKNHSKDNHEIRKYKAFISYRHLPLDMEVAENIHKSIERFVIPKELRNNPEEKHLGYVFRDKDELPISGNLSANIQTALDNSEFLIVICTPETQKSQWVLGEISYFIETKGRDHVLAVLADGLPEESFPSILTEISSDDDNVFQKIEPLAANIAAPTKKEREKLLKVEKLRLLAALIGCPFDALFKRESRLKRRRRGALITIIAAAAAIFIGMLVNRNAVISRQLEISMINESKASASEALRLYDQGKYSPAIKTALSALPYEGNERPYVAEAECALSDMLNMYLVDNPGYVRSFDNDSIISEMAISEGGKYVATLDELNNVKLWDANSGIMLWEVKKNFRPGIWADSLVFSKDESSVLVFTSTGVILIDTASGEVQWENTDYDFVCFSTEAETILAIDKSATYIRSDVLTYYLLDLYTGKIIKTYDINVPDKLSAVESYSYCFGTLSADGKYAAAECGITTESDNDACIYYLIIDLETGESSFVKSDVKNSLLSDIREKLLFTDEDDLVYAYDDDKEATKGYLVCYDHVNNWKEKYQTNVNSKGAIWSDNGDLVYSRKGLENLEETEDHLIFAGYKTLIYLDKHSGEVISETQLPAPLTGSNTIKNSAFVSILKDGNITVCFSDGFISSDWNVNCFNTGFDISQAVSSGDRFNTSAFALIPAASKKTVVMVNTLENPNLDLIISNEKIDSYPTIVHSVTGEQIGMLSNDDTHTRVYGAVFDSKNGLIDINFKYPETYYYTSYGKAYISADGILFAEGLSAYDPKTDRVIWLTENGEEPEYLVTTNGYIGMDTKENKIISINSGDDWTRIYDNNHFVIWKDTERFAETDCPEPEKQEGEDIKYSVICIQDGYFAVQRNHVLHYKTVYSDVAVYSINEDRWMITDIKNTADDSCLIRTSDSGDQFITANETDINFYNLSDGSLSRSISHGWYKDGIADIRTVLDGKYLMAFTTSCTIRVFDTATGQLTSVINLEDHDYDFTNNNYCSIHEINGGNNLLLICSQKDDQTACGIKLDIADRSDWKVSGFYKNIWDYNETSQELCIYTPPFGNMYKRKLFTTDELIELGQEYVNKGNAISE